jgi:hypothetical protein
MVNLGKMVNPIRELGSDVGRLRQTIKGIEGDFNSIEVKVTVL